MYGAIHANPVLCNKNQQGRASETRLSRDTVGKKLEGGIHEFNDRPELCDQVLTDLQERGLVRQANMRVIMSSSGSFPSQTTEMGKQLLQHITRR
jgi:hypothetical protein